MTELTVAERLATLRAAALAVYRAHSLPVKAGFYRRGPRARRWTRLDDDLDAEARWTMVQAHPPGSGWRYLDRDRLGTDHASAEVREAARILQACTVLETALETAEPAEIATLGLALSLPPA